MFYEAPEDPLDYDEFADAVATRGVVLDLKSIMLYEGAHIYINGETLEVADSALPTLRQLADARSLPAGDYNDEVIATLFDCYDYGYLAPAQI